MHTYIHECIHTYMNVYIRTYFIDIKVNFFSCSTNTHACTHSFLFSLFAQTHGRTHTYIGSLTLNFKSKHVHLSYTGFYFQFRIGVVLFERSLKKVSNGSFRKANGHLTTISLCAILHNKTIVVIPYHT